MGLSYRCSCGHLNDVIKMTTDRMAECSECGQTVYIARQRSSTRGPWILLAIATLFAATTVSLVVVLVSTIKASRELEHQAAEARRDVPNPFLNRNANLAPPPQPQPAEAPAENPQERVPPPDGKKIPQPEKQPDPAPAPKTETEPPKLPPPPPPDPNPSDDPSNSKPRQGVLKPAMVEPAGRYRLGETIDQEVIVTRQSQIRIAGNEIGQSGKYALVSRIEIVKVNPDGSFVAEQTIQNGRLIESDADLKSELTAALEKAKGTKFELSIKPNGEVTAVSGIKDPVQIKAGMDAVGQSLRVWSLMDADAWKELAGIAFFQPEKPLKKGVTWSKPVAHDWGELGRWSGKTNYLDRGPILNASPIERIDYGHMIRYSLPVAAAKSALPITLKNAELTVIAANGAMLYHQDDKRVRSAEENFRVRGQLLVTFAGGEVTVDMEEQQQFKLNVSEPDQRNLVGKPLPK